MQEVKIYHRVRCTDLVIFNRSKSKIIDDIYQDHFEKPFCIGSFRNPSLESAYIGIILSLLCDLKVIEIADNDKYNREEQYRRFRHYRVIKTPTVIEIFKLNSVIYPYLKERNLDVLLWVLNYLDENGATYRRDLRKQFFEESTNTTISYVLNTNTPKLIDKFYRKNGFIFHLTEEGKLVIDNIVKLSEIIRPLVKDIDSDKVVETSTLETA